MGSEEAALSKMAPVRHPISLKALAVSARRAPCRAHSVMDTKVPRTTATNPPVSVASSVPVMKWLWYAVPAHVLAVASHLMPRLPVLAFQ